MGLNTALCAVQMLSEAQKQFGEARRWVEQGAHLLASPQRKVRQHHAGKQSPSMTCNLTKIMPQPWSTLLLHLQSHRGSAQLFAH